jgi:hypothetical protein
MSDHIQSTPAPQSASQIPLEGEIERTPGVSYEREEFSLRLILWVGLGLAAFVILVVGAVSLLDRGFEKLRGDTAPKSSTLAVEDSDRTLAQRLGSVPGPHLEGIERESSILSVRMKDGEIKRFVAGPHIRVNIGNNSNARLFDLREDSVVSLTYYVPSGVSGGEGIAIFVAAPSHERTGTSHELPEAAVALSHTIECTVIKTEPQSVAALREWAEAKMNRYGWVDREKRITHIPVSEAEEMVLDSAEFRPAAKN